MIKWSQFTLNNVMIKWSQFTLNTERPSAMDETMLSGQNKKSLARYL